MKPSKGIKNFSSLRIALLAPLNSVHTQKWLNSLVQSGHEVHIISMQKGVVPLDPRIVVHSLYCTRAVGYFLNLFQLRRILRKIKPDLLHVHFASGYGTLGTLSGFHPRMLSVWGSDIFLFPHRSIFSKLLLSFNLRTADWICSTSEAMRVETLKYLPPNFNKICVVPFGVDLTQFSPRESGKNADEIIVGTAKSLDERYGIDILIRAFHFAKEKLEREADGLAGRLKLVIAGEGPQKNTLQKLAADLGISQQVSFLGLIPHSEIPQLLRTFSIFVAASRSESFGVSVVEASAVGIPVIVTEVGGLKEVVQNEQTGFVVPEEEWRALGEKIVLLAQNKELSQQMGTNGRGHVASNYEWKNNVKSMESRYKLLLEEFEKLV